jgi:hypothetical protein
MIAVGTFVVISGMEYVLLLIGIVFIHERKINKHTQIRQSTLKIMCG